MPHFIQQTEQKARVAHHCTTCNRIIDAGEHYWRGRGFEGGDAWVWRCCDHCWALVRIYDPRDWDGMYSPDGMAEWIDDGARDVSELRHMAQYRMRWRTKGGTLLPIPTHTDGSAT